MFHKKGSMFADKRSMMDSYNEQDEEMCSVELREVTNGHLEVDVTSNVIRHGYPKNWPYTMGWALVMVFLLLLDVLSHWINVYALQGRQYSLVIGPSLKDIVLLLMTSVACFFYCIDLLNTLSTLRKHKQGRPIVPVVYDIILSLLFRYIPLNAVNYHIAECRAQYFTVSQTFSALTHIVYIFVRMIWHAHIEGVPPIVKNPEQCIPMTSTSQRTKPNDTSTKHNAAFILVCALFSVSVALPVSSWRQLSTTNRSKEFAGVLLTTPDLLEVMSMSRVLTTPRLQVECRIYPSGFVDFSDTVDTDLRNYTSVYIRVSYDANSAGFNNEPYGRLKFAVSTQSCLDQSEFASISTMSENATLSFHALRRLQFTSADHERAWSNACVTALPQYDEELEKC